MNRRDFLKKTGATTIVGLTALTLMIVGLTALTLPRIARSAEKTVKIGILEPLTGGLAQIGRLDRFAFEAACEKINAAGGVKSMGGAKLELLFADSEGKPEVSVSQVEGLIRRGICCMAGGYVSATVFPASVVTERHKIPWIATTSASKAICERGFKYVFRYCAITEKFVEAQMKAIRWLGDQTGKRATRAGILVEDTFFGQETRAAINKYKKEFGMEVVCDLSYSSKQPDFTTEISRLKASRPDITFMAPYMADAVQIRRQMYELRLESMGGIIGSSALQHPDYAKTLGPIADYTFTLDWFHPSLNIPGARSFDQEFIKKYGERMTGASALSYGGLIIIADALERAGTDDSVKLRDALAQTDHKIGYRGNYMPFGCKFDERGENIHAAPFVCQVMKGELVIFYPTEVASGKVVWPIPKWDEFVK